MTIIATYVIVVNYAPILFPDFEAMAESRMGRTIFSSSFFQSSSESLSSRPRASLDLSTFSYAPFRTDPALLSFDPASVALSSESQGRISRNSQAVRRHQTQRESFDFRNNASSSPPTRDMEEPLDTSRTYEVTPTDTTPPRPPPPVFISCGPSPKRRPPKGRTHNFYSSISFIGVTQLLAILFLQISI